MTQSKNLGHDRKSFNSGHKLKIKKTKYDGKSEKSLKKLGELR
jgi:hypothetical protein